MSIIISLNKANKAIKQLEQKFNSINGELEYGLMQRGGFKYTYNKLTNIEEDRKMIMDRILEVNTKFGDYFQIELDIFNLREKVEKKNIETRLNEYLKMIDRTKKMLAFVEKFKNNYFSGNTYNAVEAINKVKSDITTLQESEGIVELSLNIAYFNNKEDIEDKIKSYKKILTGLEDQKFEINNANKIEIELSEVSKEFLGL